MFSPTLARRLAGRRQQRARVLGPLNDVGRPGRRSTCRSTTAAPATARCATRARRSSRRARPRRDAPRRRSSARRRRERAGRRASGRRAMSPSSSAISPRGSTSARATATRSGAGHEPRPGHLRAGAAPGGDQPRPARVSGRARRAPTPSSPTRSVSIENAMERCHPGRPLALALGARARRVRARPRRPPPPPPPPPSCVATVARRDVPLYIEAVGALDGYVNADIRARVRGLPARRRTTRTASTVKDGQLLFTIESTDYAAAVTSAKAALSRARASRRRTTASSSSATRASSRPGWSRSRTSTTRPPASPTPTVRCRRRRRSSSRRRSTSRTRRSARRSTASRASRSCASATWSGRTGRRCSPRCRRSIPIRVNFPLSEVDYVEVPRPLRAPRRSATSPGRRSSSRARLGRHGGGRRPRRRAVLVGRQHLPAPRRHRGGQPPDRPEHRHHPAPGARPEPRRAAAARASTAACASSGSDAGRDVIVVPEKALISVQGTLLGRRSSGRTTRCSSAGSRSGRASRACASSTKGVAEGDRIVVDGVQKISDGALVDPKPAPGPRTRPGRAVATRSAKR